MNDTANLEASLEAIAASASLEALEAQRVAALG